MTIVIVTVFILSLTAIVKTAPAVKYDQRQEGDVNIRADLENFVILIIPTSGTANLGLLDILSKGLPTKGHMKRNKNNENKRQQSTSSLSTHDISHFIESKTAPYHVDISRTRSHLAKLHPQMPQIDSGEVLIAHSPTIALSKSREIIEPKTESTSFNGNEKENITASRSARNLHINPNEDFQALVVSSDLFVGRKTGRAEKKSNKERVKTGENLTLLGAELDQCGPDQKRDALGICQIVKE